MEMIPRSKFVDILQGIRHKKTIQARVLCILIWMTGKRPNEILNITAADISINGKHIRINIKGSKGGYSGPTILPLKDPLVKEVWEYSKNKFPEQFLFWAFRSKSKKNGAIKRFKKKQSDGTYSIVEKRYNKIYPNLSNNLWRWFNKWFNLPPYYFRHNRMTIAAAKLNANELMLLKGSRSMESIRPYLHYNEKMAKRIGAELIK